MNAIEASPKKTSALPYIIIAVFVSFALYIGYMVKQAMSTSVDLVSKDYYQKEIAYQQHMNTLSRTAALTDKVEMRYVSEASQLSLTLPAEMEGKELGGSIKFFRPSDQTLDFEVPLQPNTGMQQHLSTEKLKPGYWRVLLQFTASGQEFYSEQKITVK